MTPASVQTRDVLARDCLLVEPDERSSEQLSAMLVAAGLGVERVACAREAYVRLHRGPADLIVSNIALPDESGWLMAAKLRVADAQQRVWLYYSADHQGWGRPMAAFIGVERLIRDSQELFRLATGFAAMETRSRAPEKCSRVGGFARFY